MSEEKLTRVSVRLLDREYQVACPVEQRTDLLDAAELLDSRMREVRESGTAVGLDRIAVISALNLSNELMRLRREGTTIDSELGTRLKNLRKRVELALDMGQQMEL
jgi:cell division protein ZapA